MGDGKVTAYICTRARYHTLALTIQSIIGQTRLPDKLVICDDTPEESKLDLRGNCLYRHLFTRLKNLDVDCELKRAKKDDAPEGTAPGGVGQVALHTLMLQTADTEFLWRIDDDEVAEPNVLKCLLHTMQSRKNVGAVAPLCRFPWVRTDTPAKLCASNDLDRKEHSPNIQWFTWDEPVLEAQQLYSTFLFRREAALASGGYNLDLSIMGHREETFFTARMWHAGYTLLVDTRATVWHYRENSGGIRTGVDLKPLQAHDEKLWCDQLEEWGIVQKEPPYKFVVLMNGIGDHYAFKQVLPDILRFQGENLIIACAFPDVFHDMPDLKLCTLDEAQALLFLNPQDYNIYDKMRQWMWQGNLPQAFRRFYGEAHA